MSVLADLLAAPTAIVGTTGAGKSYAAKGAVEELLSRGARVVIIDPTGAWFGLRSGVDGLAGGFPVLIFGGDHGDIEITEHSGAAIAEAIAGRAVQAIIDTSEMTGGEKTRFMTDFLQTLYARNKAVLYLVVDEADEIAPQNPMPDERRLSGAFDKIVRRGRIKGFRPLMITQRPAVLHKNVLSQIGTLVALKLTSPQDRKAIDDWVTGNADTEKAKSVMQSLPGLARGEGWIWSPAAGVLERMHFPPISTFDSSRTPEAGETIVAPAMTAVDVDELRAAVVVPVEAPAARSAAKADIDAAERRGYDRGLSEGRIVGYAEAAHELGGRVLQMTSDLVLQFQGAASSPVIVAASVPSVSGAPVIPRAAPLPKDGRPGSLQRALDAIAWWHDIGFAEVDRSRAAITAGLSPTASTFGVYLGKLKEQGLIELAGPGTVRLTDIGRAAANHDRAIDPADVLRKALSLLKPQPSRVLQILAGVHPRAVSRDDLADQMGLSRTASTLGVYIGECARLGLVENAGPKMVRAADFLFPGVSHDQSE